MILYDEEKGLNKPLDIALFLERGEYDQGDMALIAYDDLYDLVSRLKAPLSEVK